MRLLSSLFDQLYGVCDGIHKRDGSLFHPKGLSACIAHVGLNETWAKNERSDFLFFRINPLGQPMNGGFRGSICSVGNRQLVAVSISC